MKCKLIKKPRLVLVGYKRRFTGAPYGEERAAQEEKFFSETRAKQWLLIGASCDYSKDYCVITNADDGGYDFYIAYELDEWTRKAMFDCEITGVDFMDKMGFETLVIDSRFYAVFQTEKKKRPVDDYIRLRKEINAAESDMNFDIVKNAPELSVYHWRLRSGKEEEKYIEIYIPAEKKRIGK